MSSFRPRARHNKAYDLIPPDPVRVQNSVSRFSSPVDVEDADFTVIADARSGKRMPGPAFSIVTPENDNRTRDSDISNRRRSFGKREQGASGGALLIGERWLARLSDNVFSALVALVFLLVFAFAGGFNALASLGRTTDIGQTVNVTHVTALSRTVNGMPMLVVSGIVENHGSDAIASPRLRAEIYAGGQMVASTLFRTRVGDIQPGESRGFQAKLPQAGGKAPEVKVSVAE